MDRDSLRLARALGKPSFVVDSLFWMRDRVPADFLASRRYWVQDFIGVRERVAASTPGAVVVGPIVESAPPTPAPARSGVVVNLGGIDSPYRSGDDDFGWADFVIEGLLASDVLRAFDGPALVMGGRRCVEHLRRRHAGAGLDFASLSHADALARLRRAALVLTAPGLTTTLECFQLAVPTFFLPPQNYSQWWILKKLRERELAPAAFHWEDGLREHPLVERMPEATRVPLLRALLARAFDDRAAARAFCAALAGVPAVDRPTLAARQRDFFATLGANAVAAIAGEMEASLC
jgi:hypothetical protein